MGGVRPRSSAVHRHDADPHQAGLGAQLRGRRRTARRAPLVAGPEPRDCRVIGHLVSADHAERDVLAAAPLDPPRRAHPDRVGVDKQRHHHPRLVGRRAPAIAAIGGIERLRIQLAHGVKHEPGQVILRQPLTQARRQQQLLVAITGKEVLEATAHLTTRERPQSSRSGQTKRAASAGGFVRQPPMDARATPTLGGVLSWSVATLWCATRAALLCIAGRPHGRRGLSCICGQRFAVRRLDACVFPGETRVPATAPGSAETEEDSQ